MSRCIQGGWLSTGVLPPESSCSTITTRMISSANWAMERRDRSQVEPEGGRGKQVEHDPEQEQPSDPAIGTSRRVRTTNTIEAGDGQQDDQAVRPDLGDGDLERGKR